MQVTVGNEVEVFEAIVSSLNRFARELEPNALTPAHSDTLVGLAARAESLCQVIKGLAGTQVDDSARWRQAGFRSAADYMAHKTGTTAAQARETLNTARKARDLPHTDEAMRNGELSAAQAKEIADAATADPSAEDELLKSAKEDDFGTFRRKARNTKAAADPDPAERARRIHANRSLKHWTDKDGSACAFLRTTPEAWARILAGLEPHRRAVFAEARKAGRHERNDAYLADALDRLAQGYSYESGSVESDESAGSSSRSGSAKTSGTAFPSSGWADSAPTACPPQTTDGREPTLFDDTSEQVIDLRDRGADDAHGPPPPSDGGPPGDSPAPEPQRPRARSSPPAAVVHFNVDLAAFQRGHLEPGEVCEIPGVGAVHLGAIHQALGDAVVKLIIREGNELLTVIHHGRTVTARQRTALEARDPVCIRPTCTITENFQIDHRLGWEINHQTSLDDLGRVCRHDHDLKTHHGHTYSGSPGNWVWHIPGQPDERQSPDDP